MKKCVFILLFATGLLALIPTDSKAVVVVVGEPSHGSFYHRYHHVYYHHGYYHHGIKGCRPGRAVESMHVNARCLPLFLKGGGRLPHFTEAI